MIQIHCMPNVFDNLMNVEGNLDHEIFLVERGESEFTIYIYY